MSKVKNKSPSHILRGCTYCDDKNNFSDEKLISDIQKGKQQAFSCLMHRYQEQIFRYIQRISYFSPERAEEIAQGVWISAWKDLKSGKFNLQQKFGPWIYRIAHNHTISAYRKAKTRHEFETHSLDDALLKNIADGVTLTEEVQKKINSQHVHYILSHMTPRHRSVLVLRFLQDKKYSDISHILHISEGAVTSLLHRAKNTFRSVAEREHFRF